MPHGVDQFSCRLRTSFHCRLTVPFVETADGLLLKTIIPSRKATRRYISET